MWNIKEGTHKKGITDGYHLDKRQFDKHLKTASPSTGPERSLPLVTQAKNSPTNIPFPCTCQWHLITSVLPSVSLLLHLDRLPSHRWLCWTNLAISLIIRCFPNVHLTQENFVICPLTVTDYSFLSYSVHIYPNPKPMILKVLQHITYTFC